jgi:hypothetical protein
MNEFHHILQTLPTDPASLFVLAVTALAIVFIVIVGRGEKTEDDPTHQS